MEMNMYCTKCGVELREDDVYCSRCGNRTAIDEARETPRALMLDKGNRKIAGVCAGFARYFGIDVALMRILWLGIALGTGIGFLVYLAAWIILPGDHGYEALGATSRAPRVI
jgi:phage shock protein C